MKTNRHFLLAVIFGFALAFTFSCSGGGSSGGDPNGGGGSNKCADIANCKKKQIGSQVWLAENLNIDVSGSKCYEGKSANCDKYGRLYDWSTAMALDASCNSNSCASQISTPHRGICPSGWHIPSDDDWNVLMKFVNPSCSDTNYCEGAGTKLKAKSEWAGNGNGGTDDLGFSALPGGGSHSVGSFSDVGYSGWWWSASEDVDSNGAYSRIMSFNGESSIYYSIGKSGLFSVRCVQD